MNQLLPTAGLVATLLFVFAGSAAADSAPGLKPGTYKMDPGHTYAHFKIGHMGLSTMHGRIDIKKGKLKIGQKPADSHLSVTLDPASVDTGNKARDKHLRDMKGFFDVEKYPAIRFVSTSIRFDDNDAEKATVQGKLTLHGTTRPVTLDVDDIACRVNPLQKSHYTCGFTAETDIKRSNFGMHAFSQLVGDKVELSIEAEADKPVGSAS